MNAFRVAVLFFVCGVVTVLAEEPNTLPATIMVDGVTYSNVTWGTVTPATVTIFHTTGIMTVPLDKLPPELQKRFGYDPKKAADYSAAVARAQVEAAKARIERLRGTLDYLDARYGFRDLRFEQSIAACSGMKLVEDDGDNKYYTRSDEDLHLGSAKLSKITYGFYKGKFALVLADAHGNVNSSALLAVLQEAYGPGAQSHSDKDSYWWDGQHVLANLLINHDTEHSTFFMHSKALDLQEEADKKAKAQEGAKGL